MIAEDVSTLAPDAQSQVLDRFGDALAGLREAAMEDAPLLSMGREYMALGLPCPFLKQEACSIHSTRPVACREHLVVTPPSRCASLDGGAEVVAFPVSLHHALTLVGAWLLGGAPVSIPLARALDWYKAHQALAARRWPAAELNRVVAKGLDSLTPAACRVPLTDGGCSPVSRMARRESFVLAAHPVDPTRPLAERSP